jgi:hypothetical protein
MYLQNPLEKNENPDRIRYLRSNDGDVSQFPHRAAITAQQSCSISIDGNLIGRDGISKTTVWKKCASLGNFAHAKTFPCGMPVPTEKWGFVYP